MKVHPLRLPSRSNWFDYTNKTYYDIVFGEQESKVLFRIICITALSFAAITSVFNLSISRTFAALSPDNDQPVTRCDRLAASPYDPGRKAPGVDYARIDTSRAVPECQTAVLIQPESGRLNFQFGRALEKANDVEGALYAYERAGANGHAGGFNNVGELYRDGKWVVKDKDVAVEYFVTAADEGYPEAEFNLAMMILQNVPNTQLLDRARQLLVKAAQSGYMNAATALRSLPAASGDTNATRHMLHLLSDNNNESVIYHAEQQRHGSENSAQSVRPLEHDNGSVPAAGWTSSQARSSITSNNINVEFLQGGIVPRTSGSLSGLSCRNYDKIVHLDISIEWPNNQTDAEVNGQQRLVLSGDDVEYLFPKGSYDYQHDSWIIKGYFISRNGGFHQGIVSNFFEKINDADVLLNPHVREVRVGRSGC